MSTGTGFRTADATKMMSKPVTVSQKGPIFERNKLNTEIVFKEREDGVNFAVNKGTYYNNLALASDIAKNKANFVTIQIPNLDHDIIRPGLNIYLSTLVIERETDRKEKRRIRAYRCNALMALFSYTANNPNPLMSTISSFTELTGHATIKLCAEEKEDAV